MRRAHSTDISQPARQRVRSTYHSWARKVPRRSVNNNHGEIVGDYTDSTGTMQGFVYIGGVFHTVDDPLGVPGSTVINGVNDLGQLVGFYADANDNVIGFVGTPTPEPGTLA